MDPSPSSFNARPESLGNLIPGGKVGAGRYTLVRFLGKGGMGVVWLANDERLNEQVALKFLDSKIVSNPEALEDMRRETRKSRRLSHPNIVRIHDLFEARDELAFISMEFIEGSALNSLKAKQENRIFSWSQLLPLVRQICEALDYAHSQKVIHRDLKPANMMVTKDGVLKLADFGIAATLGDSSHWVSKNMGNSGTPSYMSPQQMNGQLPRISDDIYSLGATLYELLTSKPPFFSGDVYHQVQDMPATPIDERLVELRLTNEIPADVAAMVLACLAKDPERRPGTARAIAEWIGLKINPRTGNSSPLRRASLWWKVAVTLAVVTAIGGVVWRSKSVPDYTPPANFKLEEGWLPIFGQGAISKGANAVEHWRRGPDGTFIGKGEKPGTLTGDEIFTNFQFKAEVWLDSKAAGSIWFRYAIPKEPIGYILRFGIRQERVPPTGNGAKLTLLSHPAVPDREWFEVHSIFIGRRVMVRINNRTVDSINGQGNVSPSGVIVLTHRPGPPLMYRRLRVRALPADEAAAWSEIHRDFPELR